MTHALALLVVGSMLVTAPAANAHPEDKPTEIEFGVDAVQMLRAFARAGVARSAQAGISGFTPCTGGFAGNYPCDGVDLLSHLPLTSLGGGQGNDIWGWTDAASGREFVILGRSTGTAFVEITDPANATYLGNLPAHSSPSLWRDIKVHADHALIVSEASNSGMQVFDLTELLDVASPPATFTETAHYDQVSTTHNIVVNETIGYAYAVGSNTCSGGLHIIDVTAPAQPVFAGCYSADGYTHDAQCVTYAGPDQDHQGSDICVAANEDTLTIVDVSKPASPTLLARKPYIGAAYSHQGWFTEDQRYFLLDDELDEAVSAIPTTTYIWDLADLDDPKVTGAFTGTTTAIDHNQYIEGANSFQANYRAGLRVIDSSEAATGALAEIGYFDVYPANDAPSFNGAWSVYPYFESGVVAISGIEQGLFVVYPTGARSSLRVIDIDDRSKPLDDGKWRARAKVRVTDADGMAVAGAAVKVRFANGKRRTCITDEVGRCYVKVKLGARSKIKAKVKRITLDGFDYTPWASADADGTSDGTRIQLLQP